GIRAFRCRRREPASALWTLASQPHLFLRRTRPHRSRSEAASAFLLGLFPCLFCRCNRRNLALERTALPCGLFPARPCACSLRGYAQKGCDCNRVFSRRACCIPGHVCKRLSCILILTIQQTPHAQGNPARGFIT